MIITVANKKGGTGKTTISTNLAAMAALCGKDVILVDTDTKQASIHAWTGLRQKNDIKPFLPAVLKQGMFAADVMNLAEKYDVVIVDVGGNDTIELRQGIACADRVVVPLKVGQWEAWGMTAFVGIIQEIEQKIGYKISCLAVINCAPTNVNSKETAEVREAMVPFADTMPLLETTIGDRKIFRDAPRYGKSVVEMKARAGEAGIGEIISLYEAVFDEKFEPTYVSEEA